MLYSCHSQYLTLFCLVPHLSHILQMRELFLWRFGVVLEKVSTHTIIHSLQPQCSSSCSSDKATSFWPKVFVLPCPPPRNLLPLMFYIIFSLYLLFLLAICIYLFSFWFSAYFHHQEMTFFQLCCSKAQNSGLQLVDLQ